MTVRDCRTNSSVGGSTLWETHLIPRYDTQSELLARGGKLIALRDDLDPNDGEES